ncbi:gamma-aminobutyric acid type B receptor subunit 1-like [Gigantopelta aegis]|uniref:gamma-aminobutyric acid type B receptor subunit 1-like n=1 Tax=Gigantopelta aegis TaxID=1735272 RepID=UPI001B888560|nr:gamma-aminobutyric acid type B receptor subunit 1-like [Gigantopelta aegis]
MVPFNDMAESESYREKHTPIKGIKAKPADLDQSTSKVFQKPKKPNVEKFGPSISNNRLQYSGDITNKGNLLPDDKLDNSGQKSLTDSPLNTSSNRLRFRNEHIKARKRKKMVVTERSKHRGRHRGGRKTRLYIGGLFELSGSEHEANGRSELDAALLAVQHVNSMHVIPGYELELLYNDTKCDPGTGTNAFYDLIYRKPRMLMVMGSACVEVTKTIAEIVPNWNLILISYATTSPALSEREKYTTFFRLAPADSSLNPARRMFIQYFRWDTVAILYEEKEMFSLAVDDISVDLANHNISQQAVLSFKTVHEIPEKMNQLQYIELDMHQINTPCGIQLDIILYRTIYHHFVFSNFQSSDLRIIIAAFSESAARQVFCEVCFHLQECLLSLSSLTRNSSSCSAYRLRMFGPRFVWILCGGILDKWWLENGNASCPRDELRAATEGVIIVSSLNKLMGDERSVDNMNYSEFLSIYSRSNGSQPLSTHATTTYDTVWTMALTIKKTLQHRRETFVELPDLNQLNYTEMAPVRDHFFNIIEKLDFRGVSGPVSFKGPDRESRAVVYQNQGGNLTIIAIHDPDSEELNFACDQCRDLIWQGGRVPRDKKLVLHRQKTIDPTIFYIACALCVFGIILAVCFLSYNLHHRKLRYIKLSSPKLNNVAVIGCILVYTAVIVLGLDDHTLGWDFYPLICSTRAFLLAAGFSLSFGAMFAKTYRVHQIFTRANSGLVKSKLLRDKHLLFIIGVLLMVDSGIVIVWVIVDPMEPKITNLTEEAPDDEDILLVHQLTTCYSHHLQKWLGVFYVYKGLLLVFGVYMAWETRSVKIPALNDSQYIGLNVYNVVIMSLSVVVLSNILDNQPTRAYTMESIFMFLSTTVTLCLLFVPKIYVIVSSKGNPIIATSGILVEANTRRFVFDDKKEIYYRAEVQNRVYKRELVEVRIGDMFRQGSTKPTINNEGGVGT